MSAEMPEPKPLQIRDMEETRPLSEGVILERFKRMKFLPPHVRSLKDEFFVQSYLRRKRCVI